MSYLDHFHYQIFGNKTGNKLVFLHGLMGSAANWRKITKSFEEKYHILTFDQRGHGRSFQPESGYAPSDYADDLLKILDELGWDKIILVGHSMGGRNGHNFASRFPQRINLLVIEDIGPDASIEAASKIKELLDKVPTPFSSRAEAKSFFAKDFAQKLGHGVNAKVLGQYLFTNIKEMDDGRADWRFYKKGIISSAVEGRSSERWGEIEQIQCPTLVVRGKNSDEISEEVYLRMLKVNPKLQGMEVLHSGHWVHFDQPQVFTQGLVEFFNEYGF